MKLYPAALRVHAFLLIIELTSSCSKISMSITTFIKQSCGWVGIIFCWSPAIAQWDPANFTRHTTREGLSNNYVTSIQQDAQGYIWIATDAGLNRFDGNRFTQYHSSGNAPRLLSGKVSRLKTFPGNQLGVINRGGFQLLNTRDYSIANYQVPDSSAFSVYLNYAWDGSLLEDGSRAVSTVTGFYVFDKKGALCFRHDAYYPADAHKKNIRYGRNILRLDKDRYVVYVEASDAAIYDHAKKTFTLLKDKHPLQLFLRPSTGNGDKWVTKFQLSANEFLFINSSKNNIVYYNSSSGRVTTSQLPINCVKELNYESKITMHGDTVLLLNSGVEGFFQLIINRLNGSITCSKDKLLPNHKITCLFADKDGRIWAGTPEGLLQQKLDPPLIRAYQFNPVDFNDNLTGSFTSLLHYGNKVFATRYSRNAGLVIFDKQTMKPERLISFYGKDNMWNEVNSVQMYHRDTLWLGTNSGILWFATTSKNYGKVNNGIVHDSGIVNHITLKPAGTDQYAWFCYLLKGIAGRYHIPTRTFEVFTQSTVPALPFKRVKNIITDSKGDVWIYGHGLARWNQALKKFDTLMNVYAGPKRFNDNIVAASAGNDESIWLHNEENGLLRYDGRAKKFNSYGNKDGLPTEVFESFSPVVNHKLWIAGSTHLIQFDTRSRQSVVFNQDDGLPLQKVSSSQIFYNGLNQEFSILYTNTIAIVNAGHKLVERHANIQIQEVEINNTRSIITTSGQIKLQPSENNLSIHFTVIDFEDGRNYNFAYKINDADNWTNIGAQRSINLSNLASGKYSIYLRTIGKFNSDEQTKLVIVITPPVWKRPAFIVAAVCILLFLLWLFYKNRVARIRQKANLDKQLAETEMKSLHAQMNPHFIFNSLNSIREMILHNETSEASHYLTKFAHLVRITLNQSIQPFVSLRNAIDYLNRYIEMEKIRNPNFNATIAVDQDLDMDEVNLPPMLIQPFIENAIWHGISSVHKNIHIKINFAGEGEMLVCTIEDDGIGIQQSLSNKQVSESSHQSVGIDNVKNRIRLLNEKYDFKSSISIVDKQELQNGTGTLVTIRLPLEIDES